MFLLNGTQGILTVHRTSLGVERVEIFLRSGRLTSSTVICRFSIWFLCLPSQLLVANRNVIENSLLRRSATTFVPSAMNWPWIFLYLLTLRELIHLILFRESMAETKLSYSAKTSKLIATLISLCNFTVALYVPTSLMESPSTTIFFLSML